MMVTTKVGGCHLRDQCSGSPCKNGGLCLQNFTSFQVGEGSLGLYLENLQLVQNTQDIAKQSVNPPPSSATARALVTREPFVQLLSIIVPAPSICDSLDTLDKLIRFVFVYVFVFV